MAEVQARASDVEALPFDRMIENWRDVFTQAERLLRGLYPDVRAGQAPGSALLFDMEHLFEKVLSRRVEQHCARQPGRRLKVTLQGPQRDLAEGAFELKPDIMVSDESGVVAILDAKWKRLDPRKAGNGVVNADVYQLNAYADRYGCERLASVYPASAICPPGRVQSFRLGTPLRPILEVGAVDLVRLSRSGEIFSVLLNLLGSTNYEYRRIG